MNWSLSNFGKNYSQHTGINELMDDLGTAMSGRKTYRMLGGGNPAHIPALEAVWRSAWTQIADTPEHLERVLGNYDTPQGNPDFLEALATSLSVRYGWRLGPEHIAVVNGSQNAFFYLLNMFQRKSSGDEPAEVLLPLAPEYIGYADQLLPGTCFRAIPPTLELLGDHRFKYHIDFDQLHLRGTTSAICVSRPTNPTGNVLTNEEMHRLNALAAEAQIPLIVDNAYGAPFPDIIFNGATPLWTEHTVLVMSLSKLGLPGTRTGIILGPPELIRAVAGMNAVVGLANGNIGQAIATPLLHDGRLYDMSQQVIRPFYEQKSRQAMAWLDDALTDSLPYRIHVSEGALFLWIWMEDLPISSRELYQRLKQRGVLVVSGHYFFYGLESPHPHANECLRLSYAQGDNVVQEGVAILAEEVAQAYANG